MQALVLKKASSLLLIVSVLVGCKDISLTEGSFIMYQSLGEVAFNKKDVASVPLALDVGFGSGAYHYPGDPNNVFYTITDRGPNIKCKDSNDVFSIPDFCPDGGDKIFPIKAYTPSIYKIAITKNKLNEYGYKVLKQIKLKDASGENITGLPNNLRSTSSEVAVSVDSHKIDFDNEGLDTESIIRLSDGSFWITDEYGPSLVHVSRNGKITERVVPESVADDVVGVDYPVTGLLPDILKLRKLNRGIESIAISPDERFMYFVMQSPLNNSGYNKARNVRIIKLAMNANGTINNISGEYVYRIDTAQSFSAPDGMGDVGKKQKDVKVSEVLALGTDDLLVLERVSKTTKLYRINLKTADNILASKFDNEATLPSLEQVVDSAAFDATPVVKELFYNTMTDIPDGLDVPEKIEGMAWLDNKHFLLINDNDFGITGVKTKAIIIDVSKQLAVSNKPQRIKISLKDRYDSGLGEGAAEIVAYDNDLAKTFVVNAEDQSVDVLVLSASGDFPDDAAPIHKINVSMSMPEKLLGNANSVAVSNGVLAVAVEAKVKQDNGVVIFYSTENYNMLGAVEVGALPDMVIFTADGKKVLVANEGEPDDEYKNDPEGSVSIIDITNGITDALVTHVRFTDFNSAGLRVHELPAGVNIYGPNASVAQDLEPEYITISENSKIAWVSMQENNAIAIIDIESARVKNIVALGYKDHSQPGNELDVSDKEGEINITNWPVFGMYQPDAIDSYSFKNKTYVVSANEGDSRDYWSGDYADENACLNAGGQAFDADDGCLFFSEEKRVSKLALSSDKFSDATELQNKENLGRLKITLSRGDINSDGFFDKLYSYGARSFTIWDDEGKQVFDSGSDIAFVTAARIPDLFNNANGKFDGRSDDKGAEPESVVVGEVAGRKYAFVSLERTGGIMVYDVTSPYGVQFVDYVPQSEGDSSPEGLKFVSAEDSSTGKAFLLVANEVSGTTTMYEME